MRRLMFGSTVLMLLGACAGLAPAPGLIAPAADPVLLVVAPLVAVQVPGPMGDALTTCIVANASADETAALTAAATDGVTDETVAMVSAILARDTTIACATAALSQ